MNGESTPSKAKKANSCSSCVKRPSGSRDLWRNSTVGLPKRHTPGAERAPRNSCRISRCIRSLSGAVNASGVQTRRPSGVFANLENALALIRPDASEFALQIVPLVTSLCPRPGRQNFRRKNCGADNWRLDGLVSGGNASPADRPCLRGPAIGRPTLADRGTQAASHCGATRQEFRLPRNVRPHHSVILLIPSMMRRCNALSAKSTLATHYRKMSSRGQ